MLSETTQQLKVLGAQLTGAPPPVYIDPPSPLVFVFLTTILVGCMFFFLSIAEYQVIRTHWSEYRCSPAIMPFAKFYGHDLNETINFCMQQAVKEHAPGVVEPIFKAIGEVTTVVEGVFAKAEAVEDGVSTLLSGFESFVTNFVNSLGLVGTRIRMSVVRIKEIFGRVHGIFIAFAYAAISAITFGENLVCNPLVTFMGTITGVDVCCFAPETRVILENGTLARIDRIWIGDRLQGGGRVTSVYRFDGRTTRMVRLKGSIIVSAGHYVEDPSGKMVPAGSYPGAVPVDSVPLLYCLATDNHRIPIYTGDSLICADYEESSDPSVTAEAQRAAESALNAGVTETPFADYGLGLDPSCRVEDNEGNWIPLDRVSIGTVLRGGATVTGVIWEECNTTVAVEPGVFMAAAQLIWDSERRQWRRAGRLLPEAAAGGTRLLRHLMIGEGGGTLEVRGPGGSRFWVRDYCEIADDAIQAPYDAAISRL